MKSESEFEDLPEISSHNEFIGINLTELVTDLKRISSELGVELPEGLINNIEQNFTFAFDDEDFMGTVAYKFANQVVAYKDLIKRSLSPRQRILNRFSGNQMSPTLREQDRATFKTQFENLIKAWEDDPNKETGSNDYESLR